MNCSLSDCTGVHSHRRRYAELCPGAVQLKREAQARYKGTAKGILTDRRWRTNACQD